MRLRGSEEIRVLLAGLLVPDGAQRVDLRGLQGRLLGALRHHRDASPNREGERQREREREGGRKRERER